MFKLILLAILILTASCEEEKKIKNKKTQREKKEIQDLVGIQQRAAKAEMKSMKLTEESEKKMIKISNDAVKEINELASACKLKKNNVSCKHGLIMREKTNMIEQAVELNNSEHLYELFKRAHGNDREKIKNKLQNGADGNFCSKMFISCEVAECKNTMKKFNPIAKSTHAALETLALIAMLSPYNIKILQNKRSREKEEEEARKKEEEDKQEKNQKAKENFEDTEDEDEDEDKDEGKNEDKSQKNNDAWIADIVVPQNYYTSLQNIDESLIEKKEKHAACISKIRDAKETIKRKGEELFEVASKNEDIKKVIERNNQ